MANWFDPESVPVRLVLTFVMLASLLMSVAIPAGFGGQALLFACSYVALQLGRDAFVVVVTPAGDFHRNFVHILAWTVLSAPLWIVDGEAGQIGRDVYTYLHIPIVAGIVLAAVGDELAIAHPGYPLCTWPARW